MIFNISTDDDTDGNTALSPQDTVSAEQFVKLRDKLESSGMKPENFHLAFGHRDPENADLQMFPAAKFKEAMDRLEKYTVAKNNV